MLVFHADSGMENTFQKLIQTTGAPVAWNGRFIVMDNQVVLEGHVRSLLFHFDTKNVWTDLIEFSIEEEQVLEISKHPAILNLINMVLYVFGKWGTLKGLRVEQNHAQLNRLFQKILYAYRIEPAFSPDNFRFYKEGIRITYEDVLELALQAEEEPQEAAKEEWDEESQGLWHKLVWKNGRQTFRKVDTTLEERMRSRIGRNFYLTGYQCPKCSKKLHMAVYPAGKEQRIETEEKGVYLARAYTCADCGCFYTPRPERLLAEGIIYEMSFGDDKKAYEDYLELLGQEGARVSNGRFNEYEAVRNRRLQGADDVERNDPQALDEADALRQIEDYSRKMESLPEDAFWRFTERIEEGFYPDSAVAKHEKALKEQIKERRANAKKRGENHSGADGAGRMESAGQAGTSGDARNPRRSRQPDRHRSSAADSRTTEGSLTSAADGQTPEGFPASAFDTPDGSGRTFGPEQNAKDRNLKDSLETAADAPESGYSQELHRDSAAEARIGSYRARLGVLFRLSDRQKTELTKQIQHDASLDEQTRKELLSPIWEVQMQEKEAAAARKIAGCANRSYAQIHRVIEEVEEEFASSSNPVPLPEQKQQAFLEKLHYMAKQRGAEEVRQIMEKIPERIDRAGFKALERRLNAYEGVDMSPYQEILRRKRTEAEKQEIASMVKRARKISREDLIGLMARLEAQDFAEENVLPYMEKIKDRLRELDEQRVDEICGSVSSMDSDTASEAYEQIAQGSFLPEIKENALKMLAKRLEKIKTDECQLLVRKLQDEMQGKIRENPRHHFYPARKVMLKKAEPQETRVFDSALASYAANRNLFEYPVFVADTSRNQSGKDGMLLTPEHLFYSTRLNSYKIPVSSIGTIKAFTGLLNRRIALEEKDGTKHKIPYAAAVDEMKKWAEVLGGFVQYLQEKPASRKLEYLAKEKHDTICCFRCGSVYRSGNICPECGYKRNR